MATKGRSGQRIAVIGGGAWGMALATVARRAGADVTVQAREPARIVQPDPAEPLAATSDMAEALDGAGMVLLAVPAQATRDVLLRHADALDPGVPLVLCAKGIEKQSGLLLSALVSALRPAQVVGVLSGPGFASEISAGKPTAVTVAAPDTARAQAIAAALSSDRFRCYATTDMAGVQAGGALKNVLAIAAGAAHGAGLGASANAALITRGFAEIKRLGIALGGWADTLNGLSGLGDIVLSCGSVQSRNFAFGAALARGETFNALAEGAHTAHVAAGLARKHGIETPIIDATGALIDGTVTIRDAVAGLMARPLKMEDGLG